MAESSVYTSGSVMDGAAALMNDRAKTKYSYTVQLPYLTIALQELQEFFQQNEIPVTDDVEAEITIPANTTEIIFNAVGPAPSLPDDLVEPGMLWERQADVNPWVPMTRWETLPYYNEGIEIQNFIGYVWESQKIKLLACNQINQIKIQYQKQLFDVITDETDEINVINAKSFLEYRTASLLAQYVEEDPGRAQSLDANAGLSLDRVISVGTKSRQAIMIRRRPFRSGYNQWYNS